MEREENNTSLFDYVAPIATNPARSAERFLVARRKTQATVSACMCFSNQAWRPALSIELSVSRSSMTASMLGRMNH